MALLLGVREQRVQFWYDSDFASVGLISSGLDQAKAQKQLFNGTANLGDTTRSNMPSSGFFAGDMTFLCFSVRHEIGYWGGTTSGALTSGAAPATTNFTYTASVAVMTIHLSTFQFQVGDKPMFDGPVSMTPSGAGPWGFVNDSIQPLIQNGEPQSRAIYVLPLPIAISKRQQIRVTENKPSSQANGGSTTYDLVTAINNYNGAKVFRCHLDGFSTRDVQ